MREYGTPAGPPGSAANLPDDLLAQVRADADWLLFRRRSRGSPGWAEVTAGAFRDEVATVAKGLVACGVEPGDRVAVLGRARYECAVADYAIWWVGAVTVPVHGTASADQLGWVLSDSAAVACVVEHPAHRDRVASVHAGRPLREVWTIDDGGLAALGSRGVEVTDDQLEERRAAVGRSALATLVYTAGTTGRPKGCRLTHGNLLAAVDAVTYGLDDLFAPRGGSMLLSLPPAHPYAAVLRAGCVRSGATLGHLADDASATDLVASLGHHRPAVLLGVPATLGKALTSVHRGGGRDRAFPAAVGTAIAWSRARDAARTGPVLRARHAVLDRLVYHRLRRALGGRLRYAVAPGAPLGDRLGHFLRGIGVSVLEGYGLSETAGPVTANSPDENKVGTVGRPLPGVTVRVADDGELLFRGAQVFAGYWGGNTSATAATAEVLAGGWLHTGDLGEIDGEGFVRVTGRQHEILVTAGGKRVGPSVLEDGVRGHPLVGQCMAVGDGRPYVAALVTLDEEAAAAWAAANGRPAVAAELADDPDLRDEIQRAVDTANKAVSQAESIRRFVVLPAEWTEEGGQLTPGNRLRRAAVLDDFRAELEWLYQ